VGVFAPKGTPDDIVRKLSAEMSRIVRSDEVREVISQGGLAEAMGGTPQEMTQLIAAETPVFFRLVKELNLKAE
jgi:tripartite-type tricarboxylate transporter receptor subunit TctC